MPRAVSNSLPSLVPKRLRHNWQFCQYVHPFQNLLHLRCSQWKNCILDVHEFPFHQKQGYKNDHFSEAYLDTMQGGWKYVCLRQYQMVLFEAIKWASLLMVNITDALKKHSILDCVCIWKGLKFYRLKSIFGHVEIVYFSGFGQS